MTGTLSIRLANAGDSKDIWSWRNDPLSKENSLNQDDVDWGVHEEWYRRALDNPKRIIYIGEVTGHQHSVGVARFDIIDKDGFANASINLNPAWRGKQMSAALLQAGVDCFLAQHALPLRAEIREENLPSIKCFERCGFKLEGQSKDGVLQYLRAYFTAR